MKGYIFLVDEFIHRERPIEEVVAQRNGIPFTGAFFGPGGTRTVVLSDGKEGGQTKTLVVPNKKSMILTTDTPFLFRGDEFTVAHMMPKIPKESARELNNHFGPYVYDTPLNAAMSGSNIVAICLEGKMFGWRGWYFSSSKEAYTIVNAGRVVYLSAEGTLQLIDGGGPFIPEEDSTGKINAFERAMRGI